MNFNKPLRKIGELAYNALCKVNIFSIKSKRSDGSLYRWFLLFVIISLKSWIYLVHIVKFLIFPSKFFKNVFFLRQFHAPYLEKNACMAICILRNDHYLVFQVLLLYVGSLCTKHYFVKSWIYNKLLLNNMSVGWCSLVSKTPEVVSWYIRTL